MAAAVSYRPALDGVRAVAVLMVLLYHAGAREIPGGFLGVDVFFVLSGFLITSLLLDEVASTGRIDVGVFWFRRARRLLPALVLVMLVVGAYAAWLAPDITRERLRADMVSSLLYVANWRFVVSGTSYFEQYAAPSPLLHTWSLAIEEQFYLLWPLIIIVVVKLASRRRAPVVMAAVCAGSAVLSALVMALMFEPGRDPSRVYYGTDTRSQALLVGASLAGLAMSRGWWRDRSERGTQVASALGGIGVLGVLAAGMWGDDSAAWMYRGGFLLVAVCVGALVTGMAHQSSGPVGRPLSLAPLRWIGAASYGIYLWHWVIFVVLTPERTGTDGGVLAAVRIGVTFCVAAMSYIFVERPIRTWRPHDGDVWGRHTVSALGVAAATCVAVAFVSTSARAARDETNSDDLAAPPAPRQAVTGPQVSVFLLGDSVGWNLHHEFPPGDDLKLASSGSTKLGCGQLGGTQVADGFLIPRDKACESWASEWRESVKQAQPDYAVLRPGNGELFGRENLGGKDLDFDTVGYDAAVRTWLEQTTADLGASARMVAVTNISCYNKPDTGLDSNAGIINDVSRQNRINGVITRFVQDNPTVHLLDLRSAVCPGGNYAESVGGVRLRTDGVHWSERGAGWVWAWLGGQLRAIPLPKS